MATDTSGDEAWVVGIIKREWTGLRGNWKAWTTDAIRREYLRQIELNGAKAEANGAALAAHGLNAEVTGIKLEHTFFDPIAALEKKKLAMDEQLPEQLSRRITSAVTRTDRGISDVRNQAGRAMDKAREAETEVHRLRTDQQGDLEEIGAEFGVIGRRVDNLINSLGGL
ncbi:hypothetical protein ACIOKD_39795 [Streptomyces sp. NPDC087844]|uniref:hypothetical protein n=1 Tax=Streptomyces sp. NPDC087844 TaxID=3365805 RepID=UPI003815AA0F